MGNLTCLAEPKCAWSFTEGVLKVGFKNGSNRILKTEKKHNRALAYTESNE